ncbi:MAG: calcium-binding protein [Herbaspirillum sp.]
MMTAEKDTNQSSELVVDIVINGLDHKQTWSGIGNNEFQGGSGHDFIYGTTGNDRLFGGAGNDRMWGGNGNDLIVGFTAGNDRKQSLNPGESDDDFLYGGAGNDTLVGGPGNDILMGGRGSDTYVFARGDGRDTISDIDSPLTNSDVLRFTDVHQNNLWLTKTGNDLLISVMGGSDRITVKDWYANNGADNQIERIETADGLTLYNTDVEQLVQAMAAFAPPAAAQTYWTRHQDADGRILLAALH